MEQLAQGLALIEKSTQESQAQLVREIVDCLLLGGDRAGETEAVEHLQERAGLPGLGRLARVEKRQHPLGALPVVEASEQVPQVALGDALALAQGKVVRSGMAQVVEKLGIALLQRFFQFRQRADAHQAGLFHELIQILLLLGLHRLVDAGADRGDDPRLVPDREPA